MAQNKLSNAFHNLYSSDISLKQSHKISGRMEM